MGEGVLKSLHAAVLGRLVGVSWRVTSAVDRLALAPALPPPVADSLRRSSRYVTARDGTRIAVDVYRPAVGGIEVEAEFPVVWTQERYHRARYEGGRLVTRPDREPWLKLLVRLGYVVAVADLRGSGASFGSRASLVLEEDRWDAYDVTEWLAAQPWSTGRVGMFGTSFMGLTQFLAASAAPPHLVTIHPEKTLFELYAFARPGGVFRDDYGRAWSENVRDLDEVRPAAPVDEDRDGSLLARAMEEHRANRDVFDVFADLPYRDSGSDARPYAEQSPASRLEDIARSRVSVLQFAGWQDMWPRDALLWHRNLPNPRRLVIGPWPHTEAGGWGLFTERLRWFDHWLKGEENGVMDESPIRYFTMGGRRERRWQAASTWPPPGSRPTPFHFTGAGCLTAGPPPEREAGRQWTVDYGATSGVGSRWRNGYGSVFRYGDMSRNDARGITFTSRPLSEDLEITGHPVVHVWVSTCAEDLDLFVYLEEVGRRGRSTYVTEGVLRASHRALGDPPYDHLGLPWHDGSREAQVPVPAGEPMQLVLDLHPLSRVFRAGRRIRVALVGADADNLSTPVQHPPPKVTIHTGPGHPSRIVLPVAA